MGTIVTVISAASKVGWLDAHPGPAPRFAFERLLPFASALRRAELQRLRSHASARIWPHAEVPIVASDVSFRRVDYARRNARRAGRGDGRIPRRRRLERPAPVLPADLSGTLMINPPYGARIDIAGQPRHGRRRRTETPRATSTPA